MFRSSIKFNITLLLLLFYSSMGYAFGETDPIKTRFNSLPSIDKIHFYENLNLNDKRIHKDFFYQNLPHLLLDEKIKSNQKELIKLQFVLAEVYNIKGNEIKAIEVLKEIQNNKEYKISEVEHMNLLVGFQKSYLNLNLYSNVFKVNSEISALRKKGIYFPLWSYNIKSNLYARLFLYDKAILQLKSEIQELLKNPKRDSLIVPSAYNDLGYYYSMNNEIDSAFHYYKISLKASEIALKTTNFDSYTRLVAAVNGNLGVLYIKLKDHKRAIPLIKEDIALGLKNNDNTNGTINSLLLLSECYLHLKNYSDAETTIQKAGELIQNSADPLVKIYYYKTKAELLKSLNKTKEAYDLYEEAFNLSDSVNKNRKRLLLSGNEILYHLEEKDNLIEKQQLDINKKQNNLLLMLLLGLAAILLTGFLYLIILRKKQREIQKMNVEISAKNKTIKDSLAEKEMLLKEIHHRVKNNLQIISGILELQNTTVSDHTAKIILQEGQARIQSIALIHKTLYQSENFSSVPFQNYLTELINAIQNTYRNTNSKIETVINANEIELGINTAIPLGLIINEIITNCFKHAFLGKENGTINIRFTKEQEFYKLIIEDNGNGLPKDFDPKKLHSIGFDLIQGLTKQLGGTFNWESKKGTTIIIRFKDI
ncbi:MAG: histidine kinase dimerization/phosphoacceptor domain -containing protein [Flavobacterium sp.]